MEIFTRIDSYRWYYTTNKNIREKLSSSPYRQGNKIFALCPYCKNPVQIILKNSDYENNGIYYAKHLKHSPFANYEINSDRLENCILRKKSRLLTKGALPATFDLKELDVNAIRKAMYYMAHVSMTNEFVSQLIQKTRNARYYNYADQYNYPFIMLLEMKYLRLNNRRLNNFPMLLNAIKEKSKYFYLSDKRELIPMSKGSSLYFVFDGQEINKRAGLPYLNVQLVETNKDTQYREQLFSFRIYIQGFKSLLFEERTKENI